MRIVDQLLAIALESGKILKKGFYSVKETKHKGQVDLVTQYDLAVEKDVVKRLKIAFPEYGIVGEEGQGNVESSGRCIYIDPIDGTTNFVHGIPHCALSIGVWDGDEPLAGVVYNPILDELYLAEKEEGAELNGKPIKTSETSELIQSLIATGFPYTKVEQGEDYAFVIDRIARVLPKTRDVRRLGAASLDLCYTAQGKFDGFYEINLQSWDVAAGLVVLLEAGGLALNGQGQRSGLHDKLVVAGNRQIAGQLEQLVC